MTGAQLKAWRAHWNLSQPKLGELLGLHLEAISRWERGKVPVPAWLPLALETIERHQAADFLKRAKGSGLVGDQKSTSRRTTRSTQPDQPADNPDV